MTLSLEKRGISGFRVGKQAAMIPQPGSMKDRTSSSQESSVKSLLRERTLTDVIRAIEMAQTKNPRRKIAASEMRIRSSILRW